MACFFHYHLSTLYSHTPQSPHCCPCPWFLVSRFLYILYMPSSDPFPRESYSSHHAGISLAISPSTVFPDSSQGWVTDTLWVWSHPAHPAVFSIIFILIFLCLYPVLDYQLCEGRGHPCIWHLACIWHTVGLDKYLLNKYIVMKAQM